MWEFSFYFNNSKRANNFKNRITKFVKNYGGLVVCVETKCGCAVLIAVPIINRATVKQYLNLRVAEEILLSQKRGYILSKLQFFKNKTTDMQIFLQALVCFDMELDKELILSRLDYENSLYVDSFIAFKLGFLKLKWDELVCLANDNVMYLVSEDSFAELIRFLISNLDNRHYTVNVFSKKNCYLLCDASGKNIEDFMIDKDVYYDERSLLTSLIALNPEKIIMHGNNNLTETLISKLCNYFGGRVEISR